MRGLDRAEALAASIRGAGGDAAAVAFDVTDVPATAAALEALLEAGGPIQVVVHNAGTHDDAPLAGMSEAQWRGVVDVSLTGFYAVLRPAAAADDRHALGPRSSPSPRCPASWATAGRRTTPRPRPG